MAEKDLDLLFYALSDESRRKILTLLAKKEMTFGELTNEFDSSKQAISKHLIVLENAGFVEKQKSGRICKCKFDPKPLKKVSEVVDNYNEYWSQQLNKLGNYLDQLE